MPGVSPELNAELAAFYAPPVLQQLGRLLSQMDREASSASYGSFDRDHWGWKFRDFPLGMMQAAVYPLALAWRFPYPENPYHQSPRVLEWIGGAIARTLDRQHADGSFDAVSPNEHDAGPTLGVSHGLAEGFRVVREELPPRVQERFRQALRRACDFALHRMESHGFVSNHWAWFAVAFLDAHELLGDQKYLRRAGELLDEVLRRQSSEGWYLEYEGADPGYESFGIFHMAVCWRRTGAARLLESLRRCVNFYAHCVHPDGSVGGVYGSRHTGLYFPAGFEMLAGEIPMAAAVARFMRERISRGNVLTPVSADVENLIPVAYTWLEACTAPVVDGANLPPLPCETLEGVAHFPDAGLVVAGSPRYYAVFNGKKGGVCRVFDKQGETVAYEDAGYLVQAGGRRYTSQIIGLGQVEKTGDAQALFSTTLAEVLQQLPTPAKFIVLRLMGLTLFRSGRIGAALRRFIVRRLILAKRPGPFRFRRQIFFGKGKIEIADRLERSRPVHVEAVELPRAFMAIHMGSSKYFHHSELCSTAGPEVGHLAAELNRSGAVEHRFSVEFPGPGAEILRQS